MKTQILKATLLAFIIFFSCHQVSQQHPILEQAEKAVTYTHLTLRTNYYMYIYVAAVLKKKKEC